MAVRQTTRTIPIVMAHAGDPIGQGLIASLARPGGNITGTISYTPELVGGRRVAPRTRTWHHASRTLVVYSNSGTPLAVKQAQLAATDLGLELRIVGVEQGG